MAKVYGTIKRGRVKVKSVKQLRYLMVHKLPMTVFHRTKSGRVVRRRVNVKK